MAGALLSGRGRGVVCTKCVKAGEVLLVCEASAGVVLPHCSESHCSACFTPVDRGSGARCGGSSSGREPLRECQECHAVAFCPQCWKKHARDRRAKGARSTNSSGGAGSSGNSGNSGNSSGAAEALHSPRVCAALRALAALVGDGTAGHLLAQPGSGGAVGGGDEGGDDEGGGAAGGLEEALNMCQLVVTLLCKRLDSVAPGLSAGRAVANQVAGVKPAPVAGGGGAAEVAGDGGGGGGGNDEEDEEDGGDALSATLARPLPCGRGAAALAAMRAGADSALVKRTPIRCCLMLDGEAEGTPSLQ